METNGTPDEPQDAKSLDDPLHKIASLFANYCEECSGNTEDSVMPHETAGHEKFDQERKRREAAERERERKEEEHKREMDALLERECFELMLNDLPPEGRDALEEKFVGEIRALALEAADNPLSLGDRVEELQEKLGLVREVKRQAAAPKADKEEWIEPTRGLRMRPKLRFLTTGLVAIDKKFIVGGVPSNVLWTITAYTEQGKSTFADQIAIAAARQGWAVVLIPADGGNDACLARVGPQAGFDVAKIVAGDPETLDTLKTWLAEHNLWIPPEGISVEAAIEGIKARAGDRPILFVLDTFHEATFLAGADIESERLQFEARVDLLKRAAWGSLPTMLVLVTLEATRAFQTDRRRRGSPGVGAAAGTRKLDFGPTLAMGMSVVQRADTETGKFEVVRVDIDKTKFLHARKGTLFLKLDAATATYSDTDEPAAAAKGKPGAPSLSDIILKTARENPESTGAALLGLVRKTGIEVGNGAFYAELHRLEENGQMKGAPGKRKGAVVWTAAKPSA